MAGIFRPTSIAELILWRTSPLGVLSEVYQVASLGADPSFKGDEGLRIGMNYSGMQRQKLFKQTRSKPMSADPDLFAAELARIEQGWLARSE